jgi:hypothetical protein
MKALLPHPYGSRANRFQPSLFLAKIAFPYLATVIVMEELPAE